MSKREEIQERIRTCHISEQQVDASEHHSIIAIQVQTSGKHLLSLDDHMLLSIFDYLDLKSLLSLCRVNRRLSKLIKSRRIYRETIVLAVDENDEYDPVILDILAHTTRLSITLHDRNLNKTLGTIASRCDDGKLKEVTINVHNIHNNSLPIVNKHHLLLRNKLRNIESLGVFALFDGIEIDFNFKTLFINPNLKSITLANIHLTPNCLITFQTLKNVTNLELKFCSSIPYEHFSEVMREIGAQLTSFIWDKSTFSVYEDQNRLCNLVKLTMPNVIELCLKDRFGVSHPTELSANETILNDLLTLTKLQSLTLDTSFQCICRNFNLFLNRLCWLPTLTKLDFTWAYMFVLSDRCVITGEEFIADRCKSLSGIQDLRLGCSFSRMDWNAFKDVLHNLREFTSLDAIDFENEQNKERFKLLLKHGFKLNRLTIRTERISNEFYKTLVEICKSDRNGKGITICVKNGSGQMHFLRKLSSYDSKYVRFV